MAIADKVFDLILLILWFFPFPINTQLAIITSINPQRPSAINNQYPISPIPKGSTAVQTLKYT